MALAQLEHPPAEALEVQTNNIRSRNFVEAVKAAFGQQVPDIVWFCDELLPTDIKLYKVLMDYAEVTIRKFKRKYLKDDFYPGVLKSQATLAERVGCSAKTIRRSLERLKAARFVEVEEREGFKDTNIVYLMGERLGLLAENHGLTEREKKINRDLEDARLKKALKYAGSLKNFKEWRNMGGHTPLEKIIVDVAEHYSMRVRQRRGITGYNAISKKRPSEHKNFIKFVELYNLCLERGWEVKNYIDFMFVWSEAKWATDPRTGKKRYPYPNQIMSEKMQKYYEIELKIQDRRYQLTETKQRIKTSETTTLSQEIVENINRSAETLVNMYSRNPKLNNHSPEMKKAVYIYTKWYTLSPEYLYSVEWFRDYHLPELYAHQDQLENRDPVVDEIYNTFEMLRKSRKYTEKALTAVIEAENRHNVPRNVTPQELGVAAG